MLSRRVLGPIICIMSTTGISCQQDRPASPQTAPGGAPLVVAAHLADSLPHAPSFDGGVTEFTHESFDDLFPIFCERRSMPLGEKAALWTGKYYGKWVRWTGVVRSFTQSGLTIKQRPQAVTFDISLWVEADQLAQLPALVKRGGRVTYLARLDSYDDIFQKLYLTHGSILAVADPPAPKH